MEEVWKDVAGYEGKYQVSNLGRVKSLLSNIILKQVENYLGYRKVTLLYDGLQKQYFVHRLVAIAFIPNPENKAEVNHIDNNPKNNCVNNLEWTTHEENMLWKKVQGRSKHSKEDIAKMIEGKSKYTKAVICTDENGNNFYFSKMQLVKEFGFSVSGVYKCCVGKRVKHKNFYWRYANENETNFLMPNTIPLNKWNKMQEKQKCPRYEYNHKYYIEHRTAN